MTEFANSMMYPFLACLLLTGIHVYLGIHVIERKVIFVDLALAQIAALGSVYAILLGYDAEQDPWVIKAFSLGLALAAAAVFAMTRARRERVPQEAIIGIAYAAAVAASILASANLPHGADELRELLAGSILWVTGETVAVTACVYGAVGLFHFLFRKQLLAVSIDSEGARANGIDIRLWDFLFYVSFAVVVTSSVAIAGVLLVFAFLVVPAVIAVLLSENIATRLMIGWAVGASVSFAGVAGSYAADLPSGPVIVLALVACLVVVAAVHSIARADRPSMAAFRTIAVIIAVIATIWASTTLRSTDALDAASLARSADSNERLLAITSARDSDEIWNEIRPALSDLLTDAEPETRAVTADLIGQRHELELLVNLHALLSDGETSVREAALRAVHALGAAQSIEPLLKAAQVETDDYLKTEMAESLVELGDQRGVAILVTIAAAGEARQVRKEAYEHLSHHIAVPIPPFEDDEQGIEAWWLAEKDRLHWNVRTLKYE